jgi:hypothetical protein
VASARGVGAKSHHVRRPATTASSPQLPVSVGPRSFEGEAHRPPGTLLTPPACFAPGLADLMRLRCRLPMAGGADFQVSLRDPFWRVRRDDGFRPGSRGRIALGLLSVNASFMRRTG